MTFLNRPEDSPGDVVEQEDGVERSLLAMERVSLIFERYWFEPLFGALIFFFYQGYYCLCVCLLFFRSPNDSDVFTDGGAFSRLCLIQHLTTPWMAASLFTVPPKTHRKWQCCISKLYICCRIRRGRSLDARVMSRILPPILNDFFPPTTILNKVIAEFASNLQPFPDLLAVVLHQV